jgi:para-nitrobenzyl esterase
VQQAEEGRGGAQETGPLMAAGVSATLAHATGGAIAGVRLARDCSAFLGIRYAQPPLGPLRWRPPVTPRAWNGVYEANAFGPACIQPPTAPDSVYADEPAHMSEDCLFLNVWKPAGAAGAPVMVWIHGGSLRIGHSGSVLHDGSELARLGSVVVSLNYRLGIFGYFAHPGLTAESPHRSSGNYGLLDQIEALRWVRDNIRGFGGDPGNVTVFGESAGASSIIELMTSPLARGLFHRAIVQSGYQVSHPELAHPSFGQPAAEAAGEQLAGKLGAQNLAALRALEPQALSTAAFATGFYPQATIDGWVLPRQIVETFDRGEQAPVPVIVGFNAGEIRSLPIFLPALPATASEYATRVRSLYGDLADRYLQFYPGTDIKESALAAARDAFYGWSAERLARAQTRFGQSAYFYFFDHEYRQAVARQLQAFHGSELPYEFGLIGSANPLPRNWPPPPDDAQERALSAAFMSYFTSFARNGTPSAPEQPRWAPYAEERAFLHLRERAYAAHDLLPGRFALHEEVIARRRTAGTQNWYINVGLASPEVPRTAPAGQPYRSFP